MTLLQGDCLELMKQVPDNSIDLVLVDPPYGTMKGAPLDGWKNRGDCAEWDKPLPTKEMFEEVSRVLRQNGKAIIFSQEPYTSHLITSAIPSLPFSYRAIWYKNIHANSLLAKSAMVNRYEDICIFSKQGYDYCCENPLRQYFTKVFEFIGKTKKEIMSEIGQRADHCFRLKSPQFSLPTNDTYDALITVYAIDKMPDFVEYNELKKIQNDYTQKHASVFNLWEGGKSKSNVLEYKKENSGYHPTQKPVLLLEDLIQTYSNEGDIVLDFTMGSGSTGVACKNTNREFIGMELDEKYFEIALERLGA